MQRVGPKAKERIFKNLIAFMVEGTPLTRESRSFIYTWVRQPDGNGRSQSFYDVWDLVLQNYLPKERPILFRSCKRLSNRPIQSFTGSVCVAEKFSDGHIGHLLICDTKEYLHFEDETATEHREIVAFLTNQMSQLTSFSDMFDLYLFNRNILKDWTFIVATTETSNMNLYEGIESISGIRDRMFTPFANGRVSIINDKILKRCLLKNDSRARIFRCVSFDTQTVSYIERYYKKGTVPYEGFETVVQLLKGERTV